MTINISSLCGDDSGPNVRGKTFEAPAAGNPARTQRTTRYYGNPKASLCRPFEILPTFMSRLPPCALGLRSRFLPLPLRCVDHLALRGDHDFTGLVSRHQIRLVTNVRSVQLHHRAVLYLRADFVRLNLQEAAAGIINRR